MTLRAFALLLILVAVATPSAASDKPRQKTRDVPSEHFKLVTNEVFGVVNQVFEDGSCRTFTYYPERECRSYFYDVYCPGSTQSCMAVWQPSYIPLCDEYQPIGPEEPDYY